MPLWPASNEGRSAPAPHTGNKRLDKQLRASRERELREVPFPTVITPVLAVRARSLMLDSCDGRAPRMPSDSDSERERDDFLNNYFTQEKIDELPVISPGAEDGSVWKHLQRHILWSPLVPLLGRITALIFSVAAAALAGMILKAPIKTAGEKSIQSLCEGAVDRQFLLAWPVITITYLIAVTVDEFRAPPIGLRSPTTKLLLTILEFLSISFQSAATSFAFTLATLSGSCYVTSTSRFRQHPRALPWMLLLAGIAWAAVFAVSISRLLVAATSAPVTRMRRRRIRRRQRG